MVISNVNSFRIFQIYKDVLEGTVNTSSMQRGIETSITLVISHIGTFSFVQPGPFIPHLSTRELLQLLTVYQTIVLSQVPEMMPPVSLVRTLMLLVVKLMFEHDIHNPLGRLHVSMPEERLHQLSKTRK